MHNEGPPNPTEDYEGFQRELDETAQHLQKETRRKTFWQCFAIVALGALCFGFYGKKSNTVWLPVADSQQMCVIRSDWWGLKVQAYYPVWRKPTGATQEYSEQWCIKYPDNSWRVFYSPDGKAPGYKYPPASYNTYF